MQPSRLLFWLPSGPNVASSLCHLFVIGRCRALPMARWSILRASRGGEWESTLRMCE